MTSDQQISIQRRMWRVIGSLRALVPSNPSEGISERTHRLLWLYGFHLGALAYGAGQLAWYGKIHRWVEWLEYVHRFADTSPEMIHQRIRAAIGRLPQSMEVGSESLDAWWSTQVLIVSDAVHQTWSSLAHRPDIHITRVRSDLPEILRTARILRPHLILLNQGQLGQRLPRLLRMLRDDQRLDWSAIWLDGDQDAVLDPALASQIDGRLDWARGQGPSNLVSALAAVGRMRDLAVLEPSTGVASMGYLNRLLTSEAIRCRRKHEKFSLITVTWNPSLWIDPQWDTALTSHRRSSQLAEHLQASLRRSDVVAFDGVGRFYVLAFDDISAHLNRRIAEISDQICGRWGERVPGSCPALLVGKARYPEAGRLPEDLIAHAHEMLWQRIPRDDEAPTSPCSGKGESVI